MGTLKSTIPLYALLLLLAVPHALRAIRWRLQLEATTVRLRRLDRLLEAGDRREAERTLAAVKRDTERWFALHHASAASGYGRFSDAELS